MSALEQDNVDYGLKLSAYQTNKLDGLQTLDALRRLPPPSGDDPRIDLQESWMALSMPDRALAAAIRAQRKGEDRSARFVVANSLEMQGFILFCQQRETAASTAWQKAKQLYVALGDRTKTRVVNTYLRICALKNGNSKEADQLSEENESIERDLGLSAETDYQELSAARLAHKFADAGD